MWPLWYVAGAFYLTKLAGQSVPQSVLDRPLVKAISDSLPIALLMALAKRIGLAASKRTPLFNGALECRLFEYKLVAGSMRTMKPEAAPG